MYSLFVSKAQGGPAVLMHVKDNGYNRLCFGRERNGHLGCLPCVPSPFSCLPERCVLFWSHGKDLAKRCLRPQRFCLPKAVFFPFYV